MFLDDDLTPQKQPKKPRDLSNYSVDELNDYIAVLKDEIMRAETERTKKQAYQNTVGTFFKAKGDDK